MKQALSRKLILIVAGVTILVAAVAFGVTRTRSVSEFGETSTARRERMPQVILWAWERPTDLRFINTEETGVAFLSRSIQLHADEVAIRHRMQPLDLPESTKVMAVVRVETDTINKPTLSTAQREKLANAIADMAKLPNVSNIQIDFDATQSERAFYRELILDVPIDEAVPMLFRMAGDGKDIARRLNSVEDFIAAPCRHSYGISTDEPRSGLSPKRRVYVFNPDPWTQDSVRAILESRK
jgi:hypothetical protein